MHSHAHPVSSTHILPGSNAARQRCLLSRQRCHHLPAAMPTHRQQCRPLPLFPAAHRTHRAPQRTQSAQHLQVAASTQATPHADSNRRVWRGCSVAVGPEGSWRLGPLRDASPAEPKVCGSLRDGTDRVLSEAGGDPTARSPPVSPHYSHIPPHCGCTCTLLTAVCLRQGATRCELRGQTPGRPRPCAPSRRTRRGV